MNFESDSESLGEDPTVLDIIIAYEKEIALPQPNQDNLARYALMLSEREQDED